MCLILYKPAGKPLNKEHLENAYYNGNNDSWGIMFPMQGKVQVYKGGTKAKLHSDEDWQNLYRIADTIPENFPLAIHLRLATHGELTLDNAHPFQVSSFANNGMDLWVMHNGVLSSFGLGKTDKSDTADYVDTVLKPVLSRSPGIIRDDTYKLGLGRQIGSPNKLFFMEGTGKIHIVNEYQGKWINGCWYSSPHYIDEPYGRWGKWPSMYGAGFYDDGGKSFVFGKSSDKGVGSDAAQGKSCAIGQNTEKGEAADTESKGSASSAGNSGTIIREGNYIPDSLVLDCLADMIERDGTVSDEAFAFACQRDVLEEAIAHYPADFAYYMADLLKYDGTIDQIIEEAGEATEKEAQEPNEIDPNELESLMETKAATSLANEEREAA